MAAIGAALAATTGDALVDEVADRDGAGDYPEKRVRVAGHAAAGELLEAAVAEADRVVLGSFDVATTLGAGKMKHYVIPSEHRLDCRCRKGCLRGEADIRERGGKR